MMTPTLFSSRLNARPIDAAGELDHFAGHDARQAVARGRYRRRLPARVPTSRTSTLVWNCSISRWMTEAISSALNFMILTSQFSVVANVFDLFCVNLF